MIYLRNIERIAELMKRCPVEGKYAGHGVKDFRGNYRVVRYSFDNDFRALEQGGKLRSARAEG